MPEYPTTKLKKALARRGDTSASKPAWQESLARYDTVPASQSIQAPDALAGFSGSWAGSYELLGAMRDGSVAESPAQVQRRVNRLGQPGMGEINFRPYDFGTSRHGKYGPSLLGHPISFQVVGPTAKHHILHHQWWVSEAGGADVLNIDPVTIYSTSGTPATLPAYLNTLAEIYNLAAIPDEGLYVLISLTGSEGLLTDNGAAGTDGGVGDGMFGNGGADPGPGGRQALVPLTESSKYEIFRVTAMTATTLTLDTSKRLEDFYTLDIAGKTPIIRAITLIKPAAARVVAVPGSGVVGAEQVFAFVPPEAALNADYQPPYEHWVTKGFFDPWTSGPSLNTNPGGGFLGDAGDYDQATALPIPVPINRGKGRLNGIFAEGAVITTSGRMTIIVDAGEHYDSVNDIGKIVKIHDIHRANGGTWATQTIEGGADHIGDAEMDRLLGYFEVVTTTLGTRAYGLRWISQFDPTTGVPFFGNSNITRMATGSAAGEEVHLKWTLHDPISALWTNTYLHPTRLDSARLTTIINPAWVPPSDKARTIANMDGHPALPDKAVFDTSSSNAGVAGSNANPGSLLDLGFRTVLYPAKEDGAILVPDFDNPIEANEVVLDASKPTENQFIEIDYSAGLIHLSHAPASGAGNQLIPNAGILTNNANPRGEAVFFACFVPFSREPGQMGANPRVTTGRPLGRTGDFCLIDSSPESSDAYGSRLYWPGATQTINSGQEVSTATTRGIIELDTLLTPIDLPMTGFVDVLIGDNNPAGLPLHTNTAGDRLCTFGYSSVDYIDAGNGGNTTLLGTFGGADPAATYSAEPGVTPVTVVLRKNIVVPNTVEGRAGTDYQHDTTYGVSKRAKSLRFEFGSLTPQVDGSVLIGTRDPRTDAHEALFSDLFSSWCISGGTMETTIPTVASLTLHFTEQVVLIAGIRTVIPEQDFVLSGGNIDGFVFIDGTDPKCPVYLEDVGTALPDGNVLVGSFSLNGGATLVDEWTDLRNPMVDIDKRLDITVGAPQGHGQPSDAHFSELADAVAFIAAVNAVGPIAFRGRQRRIKIIGPTVEDATKLPIAHPGLHGLIIEGSAWPVDGSGGSPYEIHWTGGNGTASLFDITDCKSWIVRDVAFRFTSTGVDATPANRNLFVAGGAFTTSGFLFENVILRGGAHGFFYSVGGTTVMQDMTFRNCQGLELTDWGIYVDQTVATADHFHIENSIFTVANTRVGTPEVTTLVLKTAVIYCEATAHEGWWVRGCQLTGSVEGIHAGGGSTTPWQITENKILDTDQAGIYTEVLSNITNNWLFDVHVLAGDGGVNVTLLVPAGIYCAGKATVDGNHITMGAARGAADYAIHFDDESGVCSKNYVLSGSIFVGIQLVSVVNNTIDAGDLLGGAYRVSGNLMLAGDIHSLATALVEGNYISGSIFVLDGHTVTGNVCLDVDCGGSVLDDVRIIGNKFNNTSGAMVLLLENSVVTGNTFIEGVALSDATWAAAVLTVASTVASASLTFSGNTITDEDTPSASALLVDKRCLNIVVTGNHIHGRTSVGDAAPAYANDILFTDNICYPTNGDLVAYAHDLTVTGNSIGGNFTLEGDKAIVSNNNCAKPFVINAAADGVSVVGNRFIGTVNVSGDNIIFNDNAVTGVSTFGGGVARVMTLVGNVFTGAVNSEAETHSIAKGPISGNQFLGAVEFTKTGTGVPGADASLVDLSFSNNYFGSTVFAAFSEDLTFQGNRSVDTVTLANSTRPLIHGNRIGLSAADADLNLLTSTDYICSGNIVFGEIWASVSTATNDGIVMGNHAKHYSTSSAGATAGVVAGVGMVVLGNRVDTGAAALVFNTLPTTAAIAGLANQTKDDGTL